MLTEKCILYKKLNYFCSTWLLREGYVYRFYAQPSDLLKQKQSH